MVLVSMAVLWGLFAEPVLSALSSTPAGWWFMAGLVSGAVAMQVIALPVLVWWARSKDEVLAVIPAVSADTSVPLNGAPRSAETDPADGTRVEPRSPIGKEE